MDRSGTTDTRSPAAQPDAAVAEAAGVLSGRRPRRLRGLGILREVGLWLLTLGLAALVDAVVIGQWRQAAVVVALSAVGLALRRRWPLVAAAVPVVASTWSQGTEVPLLVLCYGAGYRVARRAHLYTWVGGYAAAGAAVVGISGLRGAHGLLGIVIGQVAGLILAVVLPMLVGQYRVQRQALHAALRDRAERAERERAIVAQQARLRERTRIAQDMHDTLGHQLALLSVQAASLEVDTTLGGEQRETSRQLGATARAAMDELRAVVSALRPHQEAAGGATRHLPQRDVGELVEGARAAGLRVTAAREGEEQPLSTLTQHALYRVVQESLTNAHKHAPGSPVTVSLRYEPGTLVAEVRNRLPASGTPSAPGSGQGTIGMRERARLVGGLLRAGADGEDYRVVAILPYQAENVEPGDAPDGAGASPAPGSVAVPGAAVEPARAQELDGQWADGQAGAARPTTGRRGLPAWVAATVVALLFLGSVAVSTTTYTMILSRDVYDAFQDGQPQAAVTSRLPRPLLTPSQDVGVPAPDRTTCRVFLVDATDVEEEGRRPDSRYRLCFRDGVLVEKREIPP